MGRVAAFHLDALRTTVYDGPTLGDWTKNLSLGTCILTETEQALRIEVSDLLLIIHVDRHLIEESPSGFHAAVGIVRGKEDAVDTDRVRHAEIGLVRQTPALIDHTRLLAYVFTSEDSAVEVLPKVFLDGPFQPTVPF